MAKKGEHYPIQKGPINLNEQYNGNFQREPEMTRQDIRHNEDRISGQTLTLHKPKR